MGGQELPLLKVGPRDSHKNVIKLVLSGRSACQEVVSEILEKQAENRFVRVGDKFLVSIKSLNSAGRGILSKVELECTFKNFPEVMPPPRPAHFNSPCCISFDMPLTIGIPVCYYC